MTHLLTITWRPRHVPLRPCVALGVGDQARLLAIKLVAAGAHQRGALRAVASNGLLCVLGDADALPWVDGVEYLGIDPHAPSLRLPTAMQPSVSPDLLQRGLIARCNATGTTAPLAVTHSPARVFSLAYAQLVSAAGLQAWLEAA